jgi:hypothetical protein
VIIVVNRTSFKKLHSKASLDSCLTASRLANLDFLATNVRKTKLAEKGPENFETSFKGSITCHGAV